MNARVEDGVLIFYDETGDSVSMTVEQAWGVFTEPGHLELLNEKNLLIDYVSELEAEVEYIDLLKIRHSLVEWGHDKEAVAKLTPKPTQREGKESRRMSDHKPATSEAAWAYGQKILDTTLDAQTLHDLESLAFAAYEGPWQNSDGFSAVNEAVNGTEICRTLCPLSDARTRKTMEFIARAREVVPALIRELRNERESNRNNLANKDLQIADLEKQADGNGPHTDACETNVREG